MGDCSQQGCVECGGYALERPCPVCGGRCGAVWKRDCELVGSLIHECKIVSLYKVF